MDSNVVNDKYVASCDDDCLLSKKEVTSITYNNNNKANKGEITSTTTASLETKDIVHADSDDSNEKLSSESVCLNLSDRSTSSEVKTVVSDQSASLQSRTTQRSIGRCGIFSSLFCCFGHRVNRGSRFTNGDSTCNAGRPINNDSNSANLNAAVPLSCIQLLPAPIPQDKDRKCLIIDLDETLVHSSFKPVEKADFVVEVEIDGQTHQVYVLKRPFVDEFLKRMGEMYECVLFTASLSKYADPVADLLDLSQVFRHRLFRESCVNHHNNYVKDLSRLGRNVDSCVILDNSPASYMFNVQQAVQVISWFEDPNDTALLQLIPYFEALSAAPSVSDFIVSRPPPGLQTHLQFINFHEQTSSVSCTNSPHQGLIHQFQNPHDDDVSQDPEADDDLVPIQSS